MIIPGSGTKWNNTKNILLAFIVMIIWMKFILGWFVPFMTSTVLYQYIAFTSSGLPYLADYTLWHAFDSSIWAPAWETLAFVVLPIQIAKRFDDKLVWYIILLSSMIFGWSHSAISPQIGLMAQGVFGIVFSWLYIRNNYSYWSTVLVHAVWNGMLCVFYYLERT
jgi:membrane protease YdiL (CAAX protease family)